MLAHFEDPELGGFFFTSDDHEALIHRSKSFSDDAMPAGNGIAARALIRAGYLLGETRYLEAAERTLRAAWLALNRFPHGHVSLLEALDEYLQPPEIVIIRERGTQAAGNASSASCTRRIGWCFRFRRISTAWMRRSRTRRPAPTTRAYVCRGSTCSAPVESLPDLIRTAQARVCDAIARRAASLCAARCFLAACADFARLRRQRHGHRLARPRHQQLRVLDDVRRHLVIAHGTHGPIRGRHEARHVARLVFGACWIRRS